MGIICIWFEGYQSMCRTYTSDNRIIKSITTWFILCFKCEKEKESKSKHPKTHLVMLGQLLTILILLEKEGKETLVKQFESCLAAFLLNWYKSILHVYTKYVF